MALTFHPHAGDILICDYSTGFRPPEMVKVRPVVVVSPRRRASQLVTIVPISSSPPSPVEPWHYLLPEGVYPPARGPVWVKADMVVTVGLARLDRVKISRSGGPPGYEVFRLCPEELRAIGLAIKAALGLP
jgi:mRNA interferase MazF